jgi:hypothetical protein
MTEEDIPRRLKRKGILKNSAESQKEMVAEIIGKKIVQDESQKRANEQIGAFRKSHNRYPNESELDEITNSIFEQIKEDIDKKEKKKEKSKKPEEKKSVLERRKNRRGRKSKGKKEEKEEEEENKGKEETEESSEESVLEKRKRRRGRRSRKKEEQSKEKENEKGFEEPEEEKTVEPEELKKELSVENLFGEEETSASNNSNNELSIDSIGEESGFENLESELSSLGDEDVLSREIETDKNNCPNCHNKTESITFCPNCGKAFCPHCAKRISVKEDYIEYKCPKCGEQFRVRKNIPKE